MAALSSLAGVIFQDFFNAAGRQKTRPDGVQRLWIQLL